MFLFRKKKYSDLPDEQLLEEYRSSKNMSIVEVFFNRYARNIFGACIFYLEDKDAAKDAVMQIFDKLIKDLQHHKPQNFKSWLSFVVRNHCISEIRKINSLKKRHEHYYEFEYETPDEHKENSIASVSEEKMIANLQICMNDLKERQRKCVELFYLKQKSYQEICDETGYTMNEVKSNIQNGKRNLKIIFLEKFKRTSSAA